MLPDRHAVVKVARSHELVVIQRTKRCAAILNVRKYVLAFFGNKLQSGRVVNKLACRVGIIIEAAENETSFCKRI